METNKHLHNAIMDIIQNQIKAEDPPEVKLNYQRLKDEGFDDKNAKILIGQCLILELFDVMKKNKTFDYERYARNLANLPNEPFET